MVVAVAKRKVAARSSSRALEIAREPVVLSEKQRQAKIDLFYAEARNTFVVFRRAMHPALKESWFQDDLGEHLQQFYDDLVAGKRPKLAIAAPPQHGKSDVVVDFIAWLSGKIKTLSTIYASFSDRLGVRANLRLQRMMTGPVYIAIFPNTGLGDGMGLTTRNRQLLEFLLPASGEATGGSFRNTTVEGAITGEGLQLGVIDDPIKGRKEAASPTVRDGVWGWLTDDFFTRFAEAAGLLIIMTRWHLDDPVGRLEKAEGETIKSLRYVAIAEKDEYGPKGELRRCAGEALFPELKPLDFLLARKKIMTASSWAAIYQGQPVVVGGDTFPVEEMVVVGRLPAGVNIVRSVRYWDKAGTAGGGAYTCGVLMHKLDDDRYFIEDVKRGQWRAIDRNRKIKQTTKDDGKRVHVWVEQEPGSGGKESAERTIAELEGYTVAADKVTGDKEVRAEPYAAQVQAGAVLLLAADWNKAFKEEHEFFPNGPYKDQVDAAGGAFAKLTEAPKGRIGVLF